MHDSRGIYCDGGIRAVGVDQFRYRCSTVELYVADGLRARSSVFPNDRGVDDVDVVLPVYSKSCIPDLVDSIEEGYGPPSAGVRGVIQLAGREDDMQVPVGVYLDVGRASGSLHQEVHGPRSHGQEARGCGAHQGEYDEKGRELVSPDESEQTRERPAGLRVSRIGRHAVCAGPQPSSTP